MKFMIEVLLYQKQVGEKKRKFNIIVTNVLIKTHQKIIEFKKKYFCAYNNNSHKNLRQNAYN